MSFVTPAQPRPRPSTVSAAIYLLYAVAVIEIISAILSLSSLGTIRDVYEDAYRGTSQEETMTTAVTAGTVVAVGFGLLLSAGFVVLAILDGKGKNPARIITWVLAGLAVLCFGCGAASTAGGGFGSSFGGSDEPGLPDASDVAKRAADALPSWQQPVGLAITLISILALLGVIILLALPASHAFFAKEQQVWVPPTEWQGSPGDTPPPSAPPTGGAPPPLT